MIKFLTMDKREDWDKLVRSFPKYDTYWLSGYARAFQLHGDGEPLLILYENKLSTIRGINVVMKRDVADAEFFHGKLEMGKYFDFATPYGYGGWLIENPEDRPLNGLFEEYSCFCKKNNIISEFVRFHPLIGNYELVSHFYDVVSLGDVVAIDLSSSEIIWKNFSSQNRNKIRKAIKNGVRIFHGRYPEIFETFRKIYNQTMERDHATNYYYFEPLFYESILTDLSENAQIFYAQLTDGTIIAVSIMLAANGMMNYHLSGLLKEYSDFAATNLLLYKAALWGNANGYRTLYLGGGVGSNKDSLYTFKKAFNKNGRDMEFCIGKKVFNEEMYKMLVDIRKQTDSDVLGTNYFPAYRVSGGGNIL